MLMLSDWEAWLCDDMVDNSSPSWVVDIQG